MSQQSTETSQRAALLQAYRVIKELKAELKATKGSQKSEPIAIIGLGCRFPKAPDPESFWQLLRDGVDATREVPAERWDINAYYDPDPNIPGKMYTRRAAFLDEIDQFDPHFFRLSPREAVSMDPQQRLLLEVSWEAIENAGIAADKLENSNTGVYIGQTRLHSEYALLEPTRIQFDQYIGTGNDSSLPAGRLSYFLGLQGPCMLVSTACSSSLVATHLAVQALRSKECDLALAGGVQLNLSPDLFILLSRTNALAPDGRCKTFDASADGYARGEGCGVIVLKRLSDALTDGDSIRAVIRGTAINHDGSSAGLTVPDGTAQRKLLRQAIADANIEPAQISYIEAHGTGTSLGDPIEIQAIGQVMGQRNTPLLVGSVKTNIGHLENSAGVAGIIKVVLSMEHGEIPPNLHFNQPNPHIPWSELPVEVVTERLPWQVERRIAGVSSFSFSGTNAHVILEAPTGHDIMFSGYKAPNRAGNEARRTEASPLCHLLPLSAKTPEALTALAARYAAHLASAPELADICYTAGAGRTHFNHRLSLIASTIAEARTQLASVVAGHDATNVMRATIDENTVPKIAFLFTGQGSQYINMGRTLYEQYPLFRKTLERCDEILHPYFAQPLLSVIFAADASSTLIHETAYTQPVLFALEYALAQLWKSWGIEPDIVMGHSVGEYVAACVAGVFTLEEGLKLIAERGRLMQALPTGDMYAILADEQRVATAIRPYARQISIAAINGPQSVNISGEQYAIQTVVANLQAEGVKAKKLTVSHAFHSPLMAPMVADFERVAKEVRYSSPKIDLVSNVTGELITHEVASPAYWCRHVLAPVIFLDGINALHQEEVDIFVEIGPKPTLIGMGLQCVPDQYGTWLPTLRPGQSDQQQMLASLGALYVQGAEVNWKGLAPHGRKVALPTYPFQRQRYWLSDSRTALRPITPSLKPLIDKMTQSPLLKETLFETELSTQTVPFLADHLVYGKVVVPAACHLSLLLNAANLAFGEQAYQIEEVIFPSALVIPKNETRTIQLVLTPTTFNGSASGASFQLISFTGASHVKPITHAMGRISANVPPERTVDLDGLQKRCPIEMASEELYATAHIQQIELGPCFRWLAGLWRGRGEVLGQLQLPKSVNSLVGYELHPGLLDACFQLTGALIGRDEDQTFLPFAIESLNVHSCQALSQGKEWWGISSQTGEHKWNIQLLEPTGNLIAEIKGFETRQAPQSSVLATDDAWRDWLYKVQWEPRARFGLALNLPSPQQISQHLSGRISTKGSELSTYQRKIELLEAVSADYVVTALHKLGVKFQQEVRWETTQLARQLGVIDQHHKLLGRLLDILAEKGTIRVSSSTSSGNTEWEVLQEPTIHDQEKLGKRLFAQYGTADAEVILLTRCAEKLPDVLRGTQDPLELLFPNGDASTVNKIYKDSPVSQVMNSYIQQVIVRTLEKVPDGRGIRVLEVGAGTGGTTSYLLPHLRPEQTEYTFTDIGSLFISKAQETFKEFSFVSYQTLDVERDPTEQGFEYNQYDLVIAANVLHATQNIRESVAYMRRLLVPGGRLILLEGTTRQRWVDLTFGLTEGWWRFNDYELRPDYPLLDVQHWQTLLQSSGFKSVEDLPRQNGLHSAVIVAQADEKWIPQGRHWLIFADHNSDNSLGVELAARGDIPILVYPAQMYEQVDDNTIQIDPYSAADYSRLLKAVPNVHGVIYLWNINQRLMTTTTDLLTLSKQMYEGVLYLLQALIKSAQTPLLWLVTRDAQAVTKADKMNGMMQSLLWGMGQVIAQEHPELACVLFDLGAVDDAAEELLAEVTKPARLRENWVALRDGHRFVARLVPYHPTRQAALQTIRSDCTYLITGGLGGLGLLTARWMIEQGAKHIVLMGRGEPNEETKQQLEEFAEAGAQVVVAQADVTNTTKVAQVLAEIDEKWPLRGIIHSAGVLDDGVLLQQNWPRFAKVLAPKMQGAWNLHTLTLKMGMPLDFFVLFSSSTALLGNAGQANHAAANAFLDALAHYLQCQGLPALSINWGTWSEIGIAARLGIAEQIEKQGLGIIPPQQGLRALSVLMKQEVTQVAMISMNWPKWFSRLHHVPPFLEMFVDHATTSSEIEHEAFWQQLKNTPVDKRRALLADHVRSAVAKVLGHDRDITKLSDLQQKFSDIGMDSLTSIELRNRLQSTLGCSLPATLAFNYPTISALVNYLAKEVLSLTNSQSTAKGLPRTKRGISTRSLDSTLSAIHPDGEKTPIFVVSGVVGPVFNLYPLAHALGSEQPFFALQSPSSDETEPYTRIEDIAAHHIKNIQQIQPEGPYLLGGYSFGGKVAFELAQQLHSQGHEIALLVILDIPLSPSSAKFIASSKGDSTYITELAGLFELTHGKKLAISTEVLRSKTKNEQLDYFQECLKRADLIMAKRELKQMLRVFKANTQAEFRYVPQNHHRIPIILFKATEIHSSIAPAITPEDPTWGWGQFSAKALESVVVPGDHYTMMMEPNVQILAERLKIRLERVHMMADEL